MITFKSQSDLQKLNTHDPARPVVRQLLEWLIADGEFPDHPYNPDDHGYIALVEPGDVDRELEDIDMPRKHPRWVLPRRVFGRGGLRDRLCHSRRAPWLSGELREVLESLLDDPNA